MKLDVDPFPMDMVDFSHKKVLVRSTQAEMTHGKNVVVSDELRSRMLKPHSPKVGEWKENIARRPARRIRPTSNMLIENYTRQQQRRDT
jgi:hypothetical protein